jgi:hypothetical protein
MKLEFKPEDFATAWCEPENAHKEMDVILATSIAKLANARLREWLEAAPIVYRDVKGDWFAAIEVWRDKPNERRMREGETHRARLVEIEELEKKA